MQAELLLAEDCRYQAFYCEENVWWLCQAPALAALPRFVLFISNPQRRVGMWAQRAGREGEPVLWDYHVVLLTAEPWLVWDLDTLLGWPMPASDYLRLSFRDPAPQLAPCFRTIDGEKLLKTFRSNRAHMRSADGSWNAPPPAWPAPGAKDQAPNLMRFIDFEDRAIGGEVLDLTSLREKLDGPP